MWWNGPGGIGWGGSGCAFNGDVLHVERLCFLFRSGVLSEEPKCYLCLSVLPIKSVARIRSDCSGRIAQDPQGALVSWGKGLFSLTPKVLAVGVFQRQNSEFKVPVSWVILRFKGPPLTPTILSVHLRDF